MIFNSASSEKNTAQSHSNCFTHGGWLSAAGSWKIMARSPPKEGTARGAGCVVQRSHLKCELQRVGDDESHGYALKRSRANNSKQPTPKPRRAAKQVQA